MLLLKEPAGGYPGGVSLLTNAMGIDNYLNHVN